VSATSEIEGDADQLWVELQRFVGASAGPPVEARDPVNLPMIRHWCDAMGDQNPIYTDPVAAAASIHGEIVAPPAMLQVWTMRGLARSSTPTQGLGELLAVLDGAGFSSVVATNSDTEYLRYLRLGDVLTLSAVFEDISPRKRTALGDGYFITSRQLWHDQHGELVGSMRWRILKFQPKQAEPALAPPVEWPHPAVSRDTRFFWEGTLEGELRIQRCASCATLRHPPGPACPRCGSYDWDYQVASGKGTVFSFVIHHHPQVRPLTTPFVVALVDLEEGTRIIGNIIDVDPAAVAIGDAVRVRFQRVAPDLVLPQWTLEAR
jgi:uncharacterized OB-fold protein/acyl dehydratase